MGGGGSPQVAQAGRYLTWIPDARNKRNQYPESPRDGYARTWPAEPGTG